MAGVRGNWVILKMQTLFYLFLKPVLISPWRFFPQNSVGQQLITQSLIFFWQLGWTSDYIVLIFHYAFNRDCLTQSMNISWDELEPLEQMKEGYQPAKQQIIEYAKYLGLDLPHDQKYLPIVEQGLVASLPPFWEACEAPNGQLFFRNKRTRKISSENPLDDLYRQKIREMKQIECTYGVEPINEESALRESSGVLKSSGRGRKSDLMKLSSRHPNNNDINASSSLIEHHITEESVYSQDDPPKESPFDGKRIPQKEQSIVDEKKERIKAKIQKQILSFVPESWQLISSYNALPLEVERVAKFMDIGHLKKLIEMKENVEKKRRELLDVRESNKVLKEAYSEFRS